MKILKNSGIQKVLTFAIMENISEKYENPRLVLKKKHLDYVKYHIVFDLKYENLIFGLSFDEGKRLVCGC